LSKFKLKSLTYRDRPFRGTLREVAIVHFGHDVDGMVTRLLDEQFEDGGWNCEVENGSIRSSFATTISVL